MIPQQFERLAILGLGGLVGLAVAFPLVNYLNVSTPADIVERVTGFTSQPSFNQIGAGAFGTLSPAAAQPPSASSAELSSSMGAGSSADIKTQATSNIVIGEPYPGAASYNYSYVGDELDLSTINPAVYRKSDDRISLHGAGNDLARVKFGPIDLSQFGSADLNSFNVSQTDPLGYSVYVDTLYGSLSISGNQGHWQYAADNAIYTPLTASEVLAHDELIAIANAFVAEFNINLDSFGSPAVDDRGVVYALSQPVDLQYIPDSTNIIYPLLLNGQPVINGDGSAYGLTITVNQRTKMVDGAYVNIAEGYELSDYELETDTARLLAIAEAGGIYNYGYGYGTGGTPISIELGTPTLMLMNYYQYNGTTTDILFVPALNFPITKNSDTNPIYQQAVVVPLVKELLDQAAPAPVLILLDSAQAL